MKIVKADESHLDSITALASLLWHQEDFNDLADLREQLRETTANADSAFFLGFDGTAEAGFAQLSLRHDYVEGTKARPVGYLEGIYVREQYRGLGLAQLLLSHGEQWAREKGCAQMASDCEIANEASEKFHMKCGFAVANRVICFVKDL